MMTKLSYPALGESLYTTVLPNGLPVYVLQKPGYRRSFAVYAANYGGADRDFTLAGKKLHTPAGVAHYLEHKMFDTPDGDALMMFSANGANPNAFTSQAMTAYHFDGVDCFEENLRTLLSFVSVPYFTEESVQKERGIIGQEIRMCEDNPDYAVYTAFMRCLFRSNPLRDSVAGTVESIGEITPQVLYDCHKVFYAPSNMCLAVVGDVDPALVEDTALSLLPPEKTELPARDYGAPEGLLPVTSLTEARMEVSAPNFLLGMKLGPTGTGTEELRRRLLSGLALRCLCGESSPFYLKHYESGLLNTTFASGTDYAAGEGIVTFEGESKDPRAVQTALSEEILRIGREGFDPALFRRQKRAAYGQRIRTLSRFSAMGTGLVEGAFAGFTMLDAFPVAEGITCDDASAWVREYLCPERMAMSVIYPREV